MRINFLTAGLLFILNSLYKFIDALVSTGLAAKGFVYVLIFSFFILK